MSIRYKNLTEFTARDIERLRHVVNQVEYKLDSILSNRGPDGLKKWERRLLDAAKAVLDREEP